MIKLKNILFPTDFSRCADQALTHAVYLAEKYQAALHLLHVVTLYKDQPDVLSNELAETEDLIRKLEEKAEIQLNTVANAHGNDDMEIIVKQKRAISAAPAILEYSSKNGIDLIVMGTHGRRGIEHLLLGSASEEVVRLAECPVFTIRESEEIKPIKLFEHILVPIDFSDHSKKALIYAKEIAESYNASIQILHVIEDTIHPAFSLSGKSSIFDLVPGIETDCRRRIEKLIEETGVSKEKTGIIVKGGQAANDIIKFANENLSDLVVIATHGLTGIKHLLLGSVTEKVVRMASCPVFTVNSFGKDLS